jgi:hypothetical protein
MGTKKILLALDNGNANAKINWQGTESLICPLTVFSPIWECHCATVSAELSDEGSFTTWPKPV